jgi:hypothetical protein
MSRLQRYTQKIFGSIAGSSQLAQFGSLAAGTPNTYSSSTITPTIIQSLSNYLTGWFGAVLGSNNPTIEDMNALCYLFAYQLSYLMQTGIAEWDAGTTYYKGNRVIGPNALIYTSLIDTNLNQAVTVISAWAIQKIETQTGTYTMDLPDDVIVMDCSATAAIVNLPTAAGIKGKQITIKQVNAGTYNTTVVPNGSDTIEFVNAAFQLSANLESHTFMSNGGTGWLEI